MEKVMLESRNFSQAEKAHSEGYDFWGSIVVKIFSETIRMSTMSQYQVVSHSYHLSMELDLNVIWSRQENPAQDWHSKIPLKGFARLR